MLFTLPSLYSFTQMKKSCIQNPLPSMKYLPAMVVHPLNTKFSLTMEDPLAMKNLLSMENPLTMKNLLSMEDPLTMKNLLSMEDPLAKNLLSMEDPLAMKYISVPSASSHLALCSSLPPHHQRSYHHQGWTTFMSEGNQRKI